jgi:tetratricopeptide (TPR) repeat protein
MQIELREFEKAVGTARKTLTQASDALMVARALRDARHLPDALRLAEKGLDMEGSKHDLDAWLGPIEETQRRIEQAIQAYKAAFTSLPSLELYSNLKKVIRAGLGALKTSSHAGPSRFAPHAYAGRCLSF